VDAEPVGGLVRQCSDDLDASNLMLAIVGFLPGDDPKMKATIDAIADRLTDERGLVYRYRAHDGLEGKEGTFLLCTFWLAQALALAGEIDRAKTTFDRAIAYANDVGLLAEEIDPGGGEPIGNFPQAFSHIGLVNAAWAIHEAEQGQMAMADPAGWPCPAGLPALPGDPGCTCPPAGRGHHGSTWRWRGCAASPTPPDPSSCRTAQRPNPPGSA
jgi:hypothetical protein